MRGKNKIGCLAQTENCDKERVVKFNMPNKKRPQKHMGNWKFLCRHMSSALFFSYLNKRENHKNVHAKISNKI